MDLNYVREIFQPKLEELKTKYFDSHPDDPIILHRKELLKGKFPFQSLQNPKKRAKFNSELLNLFANTEFSIISVLIDKQEHNTGYSTWKYDPYHYCQEILLERYRLLLDIRGAVGDVMIESRGGGEDKRLKKSFRNLMEKGTQFLTAEDLQKVLTSKELKVKPKSINIAGLQLADLIAHPIRRWFFKNILNKDDGKVTFADEIIKVLEPKFFKYSGKIEGYGAKKLP